MRMAKLSALHFPKCWQLKGRNSILFSPSQVCILLIFGSLITCTVSGTWKMTNKHLWNKLIKSTLSISGVPQEKTIARGGSSNSHLWRVYGTPGLELYMEYLPTILQYACNHHARFIHEETEAQRSLPAQGLSKWNAEQGFEPWLSLRHSLNPQRPRCAAEPPAGCLLWEGAAA